MNEADLFRAYSALEPDPLTALAREGHAALTALGYPTTPPKPPGGLHHCLDDCGTLILDTSPRVLCRWCERTRREGRAAR